VSVLCNTAASRVGRITRNATVEGAVEGAEVVLEASPFNVCSQGRSLETRRYGLTSLMKASVKCG
jgi:hypothetical protein